MFGVDIYGREPLNGAMTVTSPWMTWLASMSTYQVGDYIAPEALGVRVVVRVIARHESKGEFAMTAGGRVPVAWSYDAVDSSGSTHEISRSTDPRPATPSQVSEFRRRAVEDMPASRWSAHMGDVRLTAGELP
jgi:hypothetical protein